MWDYGKCGTERIYVSWSRVAGTQSCRMPRPLFCLILLVLNTSWASSQDTGGKFMIFMVDGFRWDYFTEDLTGFQRIFTNGVKAEYLTPDFPTVSHTNYYTIMTGLHSESHGMVGNYMYDERHDEYFLIGRNPEQFHPHWWDGGDPVWITAQRQGKSSHMYYWQGCEVEIRGLRPTVCQPYEGSPTFENITNAINETLELFKHDDTDMAAIYFQYTDKYGHKYGPGSPKLREVIVHFDKILSDLQDRLEGTQMAGSEKRLSEVVNLILVSDHGMVESLTNLTVNITQYMDPLDLDRWVRNGPSMFLWPKADRLEQVYNSLHGAHPHLNVYKKADLPERWHLKNHYRVPPITLLVDPPWVFIPLNTSDWEEHMVNRSLVEGVHGYDNAVIEMRGIFTAVGPYFKQGVAHPGFHSIQVYQMLCYILGISPSPHNGTWSTVVDMVVQKGSGACTLGSTIWLIAVVFLMTTIFSYFSK